MNKVNIKVEKIWSYQSLIYKNGNRTFPKPEYQKYKQELAIGMRSLSPVHNTAIKIILGFHVKNGVDLPKHVVKMKKTGNTSKVFDTLQEAEEYAKDRHYIEYRKPEIKYGSVGDTDNIEKPVVDYLEELGLIENDRYVVDIRTYKTFNNEHESIDVELIEMEYYVENGVYKFKEVIQ